MNSRSRPLLSIMALTLLILAGYALLRFPATFYEGWLIAWLFWFGIALGSLLLLMLQVLTHGAWSTYLESNARAATLTLTLLALLFLPIVFGADQLYPWMDRRLFSEHEWPHKAAYLQLPWFTVRSLLALGIFIALALLFRRGRDATKLVRLSCGGVLLIFVTMNFAATDWVMSLTPQWISTIFPTILLSGEFLSALAFGILLACHRPAAPIPPKVLNDLGNLLLAFTVFWTYVALSQLILIWAGNLPREISWYLLRWSGGWEWVALALALGQFALPFALLLSRDLKRNPRPLAAVAALVLGMNVVNVFWLVAPSFSSRVLPLLWIFPVCFAVIGGCWWLVFSVMRERDKTISTEEVAHA